MFKFKKLVTVGLICAMLASFSVTAWATTERKNNEHSNVQYELISITDIDKHPDVQAVLTENNIVIDTYDSAMLAEKEKYVKQVNYYLQEEGISPLTTNEIEMIQQKYGLTESANEYLESQLAEDYQILVQYDSETQAIGNVWKITPTVTSTGFSMKISNVGDPIDNITGTVTWYKMNGTSWTTDSGNTSRFSKSNVKNGVFYTWTITSQYVAEKFEYNYTVLEDGTGHTYNNKDKDNYIRYNFTAGAYSAIKPLGGERHHFVSQNALSAYKYNTNQAFAIRMTHADHKKTGSWGSSNAAIAFRTTEKEYLANGQYQELLFFETNDMKAKLDSYEKTKLSTKYSAEIVACLGYYESLFGISD